MSKLENLKFYAIPEKDASVFSVAIEEVLIKLNIGFTHTELTHPNEDGEVTYSVYNLDYYA